MRTGHLEYLAGDRLLGRGVRRPTCLLLREHARFLPLLVARAYSDLDGLNRVWNARYLDWRDVAPDRCHRLQPMAQEVDWRYFMDNVQVARVLRSRADAIRAADPLHRPIFAHKGGPIIGSGQDWT